jgi:hypothetical protein
MSFSSDPATQLNQLPISIEFPKDEDNFQQYLTNWARRVANSVNSKEAGLYNLQEILSFKQYFKPNDVNNFRVVYRKTFDLVMLNGGPIPPNATIAFPHNITGLFQAGDIKADCNSSGPTAIYFSQMGHDRVWLDVTNINFTNPIASPLFGCIAIAEYLKN